MGTKDFNDLKERFEFVAGAVQFAMEETAGKSLGPAERVFYALSMFICAVDGTDIVQKDDLSSAHETLVRHNVYMRDGFLFRAANFPTGPRAWVELVDGVPAAVAALYRAAVEAMDPSMRALVASLNAALAEDSPNAQAQSKRRQMIRRIAYWLQSRPEFKGLGLKELEVLVTAVGIGAVHQLEVPKDQLLQVVPKGEG